MVGWVWVEEGQKREKWEISVILAKIKQKKIFNVFKNLFFNSFERERGKKRRRVRETLM